eukprot:TRINITY_DN525456_c0_g1_i1.p1 TRINITY_DN525456_c0_g1~~TRINITY_DN525456_c0_g1_i1.p1  ORF type:complete len:318 (+),score=66.01 TRINITY_DN525456_c0_g1_i1:34-987(+)
MSVRIQHSGVSPTKSSKNSRKNFNFQPTPTKVGVRAPKARDDERTRITQDALNSGPDEVISLLKKYPEMVEHAFQLAMVTGDERNVAAIMSQGGIPTKMQEKGILQSALHNRKGSVQTLINARTVIPKPIVTKLLATASAKGHSELLKDLLDKDDVLDISDDVLERSIMTAIARDQADSIDMLLNHASIEVMSKAIVSCTVRQKKDWLLRILRRAIPMVKKARRIDRIVFFDNMDQAATVATNNGCEEILSQIIAIVSQPAVDRCIIACLERNLGGCLKILVPKASYNARTQAAKYAKSKSQHEFAALLMARQEHDF